MRRKEKEKAHVKTRVKSLTKDSEKEWNSSPVSNIPEYNAETDRFCPKARYRKYNRDQKVGASMSAEKGKQMSSEYLNQNLENKYTNIPLKISQSLREKATMELAAQTGSQEEIEILRKIIVREKILKELSTLLQDQDNATGCISEVVSLVNAIRYQTIEIVEGIQSWQLAQQQYRAFLFRGVNFLCKIVGELDFLDNFDDIVEKFCFEFRNNPFAYSGGGDMMNPSFNAKSVKSNNKGYHQGPRYAKNMEAREISVDGIQVSRLRVAEQHIRAEVDMVEKMRLEGGDYRALKPGDAFDVANVLNSFGGSVEANYSMLENSGVLQSSGSTNDSQLPVESPTAMLRPNPVHQQKFSANKIKKERIAQKLEEYGEMKAIGANLEEKINVLVRDHQAIQEKFDAGHILKRELLSEGKEVSAKHLTLEMNIMRTELTEINTNIKDLERQSYFMAEERKRLRMTTQRLQDEIQDEKARKLLQRQVTREIKNNGVGSALRSLNKTIDSSTSAKGSKSVGAKRKQTKSSNLRSVPITATNENSYLLSNSIFDRQCSIANSVLHAKDSKEDDIEEPTQEELDEYEEYKRMMHPQYDLRRIEEEVDDDQDDDELNDDMENSDLYLGVDDDDVLDESRFHASIDDDGNADLGSEAMESCNGDVKSEHDVDGKLDLATSLEEGEYQYAESIEDQKEEEKSDTEDYGGLSDDDDDGTMIFQSLEEEGDIYPIISSGLDTSGDDLEISQDSCLVQSDVRQSVEKVEICSNDKLGNIPEDKINEQVAFPSVGLSSAFESFPNDGQTSAEKETPAAAKTHAMPVGRGYALAKARNNKIQEQRRRKQEALRQLSSPTTPSNAEGSAAASSACFVTNTLVPIVYYAPDDEDEETNAS